MHIGIISNLLQQNTINNNKGLTNSLEKLSTGLRINKASNDASGLSISDKLRTQASGIKQGIENANSAIAMMNIADKAISEMSNILDTIKAKAIQMNTDTTSEDGRVLIKNDILKLIDSYDKIACSTNYNKTPLLTGCASPFDFQIADNASDLISVEIDNIQARQMGLDDPNKLKNFISGFAPIPVPTPTTPTPPTIGTPGNGIVLSNDLNNRVNYSSNPAGNFMIEIPTGTKNLTIHLNDHGMNDTIQIFTKDGTHVAGTPAGHSSWDNGYSPANIIYLYPNKFNIGATYSDDISRYPLNSTKDALGSTTVNWIDKQGSNQVFNLNANDEIIVIPNVTENLVVFINGNGSYDVGAEWESEDNENIGSIPIPDEQGCACDSIQLVRDDTNPTLKVQAQILMDVVDASLSQLNSQRANVGAGTNQLESSARNNLTGYVNLKNAESIIRDVDYAQESANFNKSNIIAQAGSFVLSQASQVEKNWVAQLLK
ncbi:putative flagellin [Aliarcobacter faecis]|uniref:flagellin N-terminal helical domain-containing protein n=1 Tax=Aliarcobacter faecis TaxID=1564138 RepID=UPI0004B4A457|nr:flagellin [Aliarcobacter faecis]QKF73855.1 putative flagellin [Aliarcobacter faecis]